MARIIGSCTAKRLVQWHRPLFRDGRQWGGDSICGDGKDFGVLGRERGIRRSLAHRSGQEAISLGDHIIPLNVSFHLHEAATIVSASEDC